MNRFADGLLFVSSFLVSVNFLCSWTTDPAWNHWFWYLQKNINIWGLRKLLLLFAVLKGVVIHAIKEVKAVKNQLSFFDNFFINDLARLDQVHFIKGLYLDCNLLTVEWKYELDPTSDWTYFINWFEFTHQAREEHPYWQFLETIAVEI